MKLRLAFIGFRHAHIDTLYDFAHHDTRVTIAGATEDDADAADAARERGIELTDASSDALFDRAREFDAVAVGDYYGRRGALAIRALEAGKHVLSDKPLCTSLDELSRIDELRRARSLVVGCMFTNRDSGRFRAVKRLYAEGAVGALQTISFSGQHPLLYGTRPGWYFERNKHGGTWNDIGIHAFDAVPWLFGVGWKRLLAARVWNTRLTEVPHFQVGAQAMLELEDGSGVLGDVSYLSPDSQGYTVPQYWRYTVHGTAGILETGMNVDGVRIWRDGASDGETLGADPNRPNGSVEDFLNEVAGHTERCELTAENVITSTRIALSVQEAAERGEFPRKLGGTG